MNNLNEAGGNGQPPIIVILKRKTIRAFPDGTKVALYHSDKLGKDFVIAFDADSNMASSEPLNATFHEEFVAEDTELIFEAADALETLRKIRDEHSATHVKHPDNKKTFVDPTTAHAMLTVHSALSPENQVKMKDYMNKSKEHFHKMVDFTWKNVH